MVKSLKKILFVGLGSIGQRHLRNLVKLAGENLKLYAYRVKKECPLLNDKLEISDGSVEEKYNIELLDNLEEAWKRGINCVFVCNPSSMHMKILLEAAKHNCDIFLEKPVSNNLEGIEELEHIIKSNALILHVGFQYRYHPCVKEVEKMLEDKSIGNIISVRAEIGENVTRWHKYEDYRDMYACRKELGGGVVLSQIHELDYLIYFFGMPERVFAIGGKYSDLEIDVEDAASVLLDFKSGKNRIPVILQQDYLQNPAVRNCKITGTKGSITFDLLKGEILVYGESGQVLLQKQYIFERNDLYVKELQDFMKSIGVARQRSSIPLSEGVKSLKVALAIKQSIEMGEMIEV